MSLSPMFSTISTLYMLVLGLCFLAEVEKCIAAVGASRRSFGSNKNSTTTSSRHHDGRMLESMDTIPGEFPFFAQWGGCGATLIWDDILLTSASCNAVSDESVLVGAHVSNRQEGDSVRRSVVSRRKHPEFDPKTLANNFMLLKINKKVDSLPHVWIDPTAGLSKDAELYVIGFGFTASLVQVHHIYSRTFHHSVLDTSYLLQHGNDVSPTSRLQGSVLQKAKISIVPHATCNAYDQYAGFIDDESMICANDDQNTCLGDNGGPLCMMVNDECLQVGIVSFGDSCMMGNKPTVFSSLAPVHGWIEKNVCALSENPPSTCRASVISKKPVAGSSSFSGRFPLWELNNASPLLSTDHTTTVNSEMPSDGPSLAPSASLFLDLNKIRPPPLAQKSNGSIVNAMKATSEENKKKLGNDTKATSEEKTIGNSTKATNEKRNETIGNDTKKTSEESKGTIGNDTKTKESNGNIGNATKTTGEEIGVGQGNRNLIVDSLESFFESKEVPVGIVRLPEEPNLNTGPDDSSFIFPIINETPESSQSISDSLEIEISETVPLLSTKKLGQCEGDCDSDEDCAEGLYCFMKDSETTSVPGCSGSDTSRTDYCTRKTEEMPSFPKPLPELFVFPENPPDISNLPLKRCQGDCDSDSDCAAGLICYHRPPHKTTIPGCFGISTTRTDFCVDLNWRNAPVDEEAFDSTFSPTPEPTFSSTTAAPTLVPLRIVTPSPTTSEGATEENTLIQAQTKAPTFTKLPTNSPTNVPTFSPTKPRLNSPTNAPTNFPTKPRTNPPTKIPTFSPTKPRPTQSRGPTFSPTKSRPTPSPTKSPTFSPTKPRTNPPTKLPTGSPTTKPKKNMTKNPTLSPTKPRTNPPTRGLPEPRVPPPTRAPQPGNATLAKNPVMANVTLAIYLDPWPQEVSWKIEDESGSVVATVPTGTYQSPQDQALENLSLRHGETYLLTLEDAGNDGIAGIGTLYEVFLTDHPETVLLDGNGVFDDLRNETFRVPTLEEYPAPTTVDVTLPPILPTFKVYLTIVFDNWHQETAWTIVDESDPTKLYAEANYDTYRAGESITEEILLPVTGGNYVFTIRDFFNDGIQDGNYLLMTASGQILLEGMGDFGSHRSHAFQLPEWEQPSNLNNNNGMNTMFANMRDDDGTGN